MKTTVVNVKGGRVDVYIGRGGPFGNPFVLGVDGDRAEVIRKFGIYFKERLERDASFKAAVEELRGKRLGCFCAPLPCHGDVIAEYLDKPR